MSSITEPGGGDGPNKGDIDPSEGSLQGGSSPEHREDEGRGEGGGREGGDQPKTASKGINPVQHSE